MLTYLRILFVLIALVSLSAADISSQYAFTPVKIGGGGWVLGVAVHPTSPGVVYCRTDVGGAYKWDESTQQWTQLITASRMPANLMAVTTLNENGAGSYRVGAYGVESFALDPANAQVVYLATGSDDTSSGAPGFVLKSTNGGASFTWLTGSTVRIAGNGEGRGMERMQVDATNGNVVYLGSRIDGLTRSLDGGSTWSRLTDVPVGLPSAGHNYGISGVAIDPGAASVSGRSARIYAAVCKQGIWTSSNGGDAWTKISGGTNQPSDDALAFRTVVAGGTLLVAYESGQGIWKYTPADCWTDISPQANKPWELSVDPTNPQRMYAFCGWGMQTSWRSLNGGMTWTELVTNSSTAAGKANFVSTIAPWKTTDTSDTAGWRSIGRVVFDPHVSGRMWFAEGFGMWRCDNLSDANNSPVFHDISGGIEEMVCNQVLDLPGSKTLVATWDRPGFISTDSAVSPAASPFSGVFSDMNAAASCGGDPSFVVATLTDHGYLRFNSSAFSGNGGDTWTDFASTPRTGDPTPVDLKFGEIVVSATDINRLVWYPRNTDPKIFTSTDRGATWSERLHNGFSGPGVFYLESHRALLADRVIQRFGLYSWDNGSVLTSTDGFTWALNTSTGLPTYAWWAIHQATPGHANDWWFATGYGGGQQGLWRSTNGGQTYMANPGWQDTWAFGFGKAAADSAYPTIYAYGRRADQWGLYRSTDSGATWDRCTDYPLGLFDKVTSITGDMDTFGRVHIGYSGNTAVEGHLSVAPTNVAPMVSAGADTSLVLPATALLSGTVTDDGLPAPATITTHWTQVSGPGTVTFGTALATTTTASFSVAGIYVLHLTASDSVLSAGDDVEITVSPAPESPAPDPAGAIGTEASGGNRCGSSLATMLMLIGLALCLRASRR